MVVVDGRVGYVGGSGIEDHYNDERFYDVMCRVEGPIVAQLQSVFLLELATPRTARRRTIRRSSLLPAGDARGRPRCAVPGADDGPLERARAPATTRSATRSSVALEDAADRDPHRQPVHLEPGDPGADPGGRAARRACPPRSPRASRRRRIRPRPSATGTAGSWTPASRSCSTRRWRTPRCCGSTTRSSSAAATSTTCRSSATTSWTCCSTTQRSPS